MTRAAAVTVAALAGAAICPSAARADGGGAWAQATARIEAASPGTASIGAEGAGDATVRCGAGSLALALRAAGETGLARPGAGLRSGSLRWCHEADTEVLIGSLRVHFGAGCVAGDDDWDDLAADQRRSARLLRSATTLSLSSTGRPGALLRLRPAGLRLAVWALAPGEGTEEGRPLSRAAEARVAGVALGGERLLVAAVRAPAASGRGWWGWSWSAVGRLGARGATAQGAAARAAAGGPPGADLLLELSGPVAAGSPPAPGAWDPAQPHWRRALARRITAVGGRWHVAAHRLIGELEGAFRWQTGLSPAGAPAGASAGAGGGAATRGWRLRWGLPGLAGVAPALALACRERGDEGGGLARPERSARLELCAQPWSGLTLRAGFEARTVERLRGGSGSEGAGELVETAAGGLDLEARLDPDERLSCVLRFRQRGESQSLDPAAQARRLEIIEAMESDEATPAAAESDAEPVRLREREGSALWFRTIWTGPGRARAGLGLAAVPLSASMPALVPARLPPGGSGWRVLGAGAHRVEAWYGLVGPAWSVEIAASWCRRPDSQRPEAAVILGAAWRARLARPADGH